MSAYIVSDRDINYLVSYAVARQLYYGGNLLCHESDGQPIADMLLAANHASVNYRYRENDSGTIKFTQSYEDFKPVEVLKALQHYDYQACEVPDYELTPAAQFINRIRNVAIGSLPGYDAAPWGAPEEPQVQRISLMSLVR